MQLFDFVNNLRLWVSWKLSKTSKFHERIRDKKTNSLGRFFLAWVLWLSFWRNVFRALNKGSKLVQNWVFWTVDQGSELVLWFLRIINYCLINGYTYTYPYPPPVPGPKKKEPLNTGCNPAKLYYWEGTNLEMKWKVQKERDLNPSWIWANKVRNGYCGKVHNLVS